MGTSNLACRLVFTKIFKKFGFELMTSQAVQILFIGLFAMIENCEISRLLFADDLVLLSSTESGLQRARNSFADACDTSGMKISTAKTELQVNGATLKDVEKFKYLEGAITSDGRQYEEMDIRST